MNRDIALDFKRIISSIPISVLVDMRKHFVNSGSTDSAIQAAILHMDIEILARKWSTTTMVRLDWGGGFDKAFIEADMQQFYSVIHNLVIYDWNKIGAEGEKSHGENGISRGYADRNTYLSSVIPFATVI